MREVIEGDVVDALPTLSVVIRRQCNVSARAGGSIKSSTMGGSALKRTCIKSMRFSTASAERCTRAHGELSSQVVRSPRW
jgi:hypothetical protein